jgi:hypothetical protein
MARLRPVEGRTEVRAFLTARWARREAHWRTRGGDFPFVQPYTRRLDALAAGLPVEVGGWELPAALRPAGAGPQDRLRVDGDDGVTVIR